MKVIIQYFSTFIVLVSLTSTHLLYAQKNIDSLEQNLDLLEGKEKITTLHKISKAYKFSNKNKAIKYAQMALDLSNDTNSLSFAKSEENLGEIYESQQQRKKALLCYHKALEVYQHSKNTEKETVLNQKLANLYTYLQDYDNAIKYMSVNLYFYEKQKKWLKAGRIAYNLAKISQKQLKENYALDLLEKAVKYFKQVKNQNTLAVALNDLAEQQEKLNKTSEALINYLKAIPLLKEQHNYAKVPQNLWAIATLYKKQKMYKRALIYFQDLKKWNKKMGNQENYLEVIYEIANIYINEQKYQKAILEVSEGIKLSEEFDFDSDKFHQANINIYIATQEYQKAFYYQKEHLQPKKLKTANFISNETIINPQSDLKQEVR